MRSTFVRRLPTPLLLALLLLSVPPGPARAEDSPLKTYRKALIHVLIQQKTYEKKEMDRDLRRAYATYIQPWLDRGKPDAPTVIEYDFSGYRAVYEKWAGYEKQRVELAEALAKTGGEEVAKTLATDLLETVGDIEKQNLAIAKSTPKSYSVHDQLPAIYRFGDDVRYDGLIDALGSMKDEEALKYLRTVAWEKAEKHDRGRRTQTARIALLDVFARTGAKEVEPLLSAAANGAERRLRIVGMEGLARLPMARDPLRELLTTAAATDPCFFVRVAAIQCLGDTVRDPRAVPALAKALAAEIEGDNGVLRAHLRHALTGIVGKDIGDAPDSWLAWYKRNKAAIEDGSWKRGEDAGKSAAPDEKDSVAFYDIRTISKRFIVLVDASDTLIKPVDIELAKKKNFFQWHAMSAKDRDYVSQYELLKRETLAMVSKLTPRSFFNLVILNGSSKLTPFWPHGLAPGEEEVKRRVEPFLDGVVVGGWTPQIEGIWGAYRMAGVDPFGTELPDRPVADTFFLLSDGVPSGGEIMYGPALVDEVRRQYRFIRIPIHTIRIDDYKDTAEEVMKGIADVTGGTYVWRKKP